MNFYTNVSRYGNMLLYRGIENGKRVQKKIKYKVTPEQVVFSIPLEEIDDIDTIVQINLEK